ncbi:hypothetical protein H0242_31255 (plasmid) [Bacillus thuringiensis serovar sumiyoshiensis]|nr:hypothetical protein BK710_19035 [Bacillus thuringiensis serovar sumiyoshiensis]
MVTVLESKDVKIRKCRQCYGCARKFEKGDTLNVVKSVDTDGFTSTYWCKTCEEYWNKYMESGDEIYLGELKSEDPETWEEVRQKIEKGNGK